MKNLLTITTVFIAMSAFSGHHEMGEHNHSMGNSEEWEIETYTSAAPAFIGDHATVIGASGKVLREGTNGWRCEPFMPMPEGGFENAHSAAPACSDKNSVAWANAYKAGTVPDMEGDGWMWMIHGDLGVDNFTIGTDGQKDAGHKHYIESGPHMMLMPKDPASLKGLTTDFNSGGPYIMFQGTGYDHVMIPVEGYYDYQAQK